MERCYERSRNMRKIYTLEFVEQSKREFLDLAKNIQRQIKEKIEFFMCAQALVGKGNIYRFRVGDYRILFQLKEEAILLLLVKHRKDIYEEL